MHTHLGTCYVRVVCVQAHFSACAPKLRACVLRAWMERVCMRT